MYKCVYRAIAVGMIGTMALTVPSVSGLVAQAKELNKTETLTAAGGQALFTDAIRAEQEKAEAAAAQEEATTAGDAEASANNQADPSPVEDVTVYGYKNLGIAKVDSTLNVREEPDTEASIVGKMPNQSAAEIVETLNGWYKIQSGDVSGYVSSDYIVTGMEAKAMAEEVKKTIATVDTTTLNVREEPSTDCSILALMPKGEELDVIEDLGDWAKVDLDDSEGYVSKDYVKVDVQLPKAMTMTEVRYGEGVSDVRVDLVSYATQFVGNPYVWGGTSLTRGADCSGFTLSIYAKYGIYLPHSSRAQANCGTRVRASEAKPGDLFFYGSGKSISHVAIYIGNGQIVHASSRKTGIKISNAYYRSPICVTRLLD